MVLSIAEAFATSFFPTQYVYHIGVAIVVIIVLRAFSQGRKTNRERDLHARTILVTGGFTPLGLTLLQSLAERGAHIIALSPDPIESPKVAILIDLLRTTTSNEQIYAEECDLTKPGSIRSFCTKFLTEKEQRLDAIIFGHEHQHIGSPKRLSPKTPNDDQQARDAGSLASFLITTLLLPALLVAPVERDIRIINVINPFYAAATGPAFEAAFSTAETGQGARSKSIFLQEGQRALRSIVFTRHLQRVLDALPAAQVPKTEDGANHVPVVSSKLQKSNIVAITVSPGFGRVDTVSSFFNADVMSPQGSYLGLFLYLLGQPLLRIFTKSPFYAMQSILHVLYLPTPFKVLAQTTFKTTGTDTQKAAQTQGPLDASSLEMPEEILLPGALYSDCAAVGLKINITQELRDKDFQERKEAALLKEEKEAEKKDKGKGKGKVKAEPAPLTEDVLDIPDDGEYGGELAGRLVWEGYEDALKIWEKENPAEVVVEKPATPKPQEAPSKARPTTEAEEDPDVYR